MRRTALLLLLCLTAAQTRGAASEPPGPSHPYACQTDHARDGRRCGLRAAAARSGAGAAACPVAQAEAEPRVVRTPRAASERSGPAGDPDAGGVWVEDDGSDEDW